MGGKGVKARAEEGGKEKKMHKQMLVLGIDAIKSVSQLMTNSIEKGGEQTGSSYGVSESNREKLRGRAKADLN